MEEQSNDLRRVSTTSRLASRRGFVHILPAGTDVMCARSSTLQGLISQRSQSNLPLLAGGWKSLKPDIESGYGDLNPFDDDVLHMHSGRRHSSFGPEALITPQMRSMRLIGNSNPRYQWEQYIKTDEELKDFKKPLRKYYEHNSKLAQQFLFIDRLLDSSLPHNLLSDYENNQAIEIPSTIAEEPDSPGSTPTKIGSPALNGKTQPTKIKRTPKAIYRVPAENTPLLGDGAQADEEQLMLEDCNPPDAEVDSDSPIVTVAIAINFSANAILLLLKIAVAVLTSSLSVLASLVDAALDFLSTVIVYTTARIVSGSSKDPYGYPAGRRRLEPIGVLVFGVIMITSFAQVLIESISRLASGNHEVVVLTVPAIAIMGTTVVIKLACWFWCRLVRNSSVQALAEDAWTDVVFNTFSIIFPLLGYYLQVWWLDATGGLLLSLYVMFNWSRVSAEHIKNLSGAAADPDKRNILLYLTMRFAKTIKQIQGMTAYHAGDKLICEVDIVLDEHTPLRDSHDLGESLQYVLESVPFVDRAFVHMDYRFDNLPTHLNQQE